MDENSQVVQWLWDILNGFSDSEKVLFLRFVCGRSRLPSNLSDFTQYFQVKYYKDYILFIRMPYTFSEQTMKMYYEDQHSIFSS